MTVIAGYTNGKTWAIAADSGIFEGGDYDGDEGSGLYWEDPVSKIWQKDDSLIGAAGDVAACELAQSSTSGDPYKILAYMKASEPRLENWNVLVVTKKEIFYLSDDYSVSRFKRGYMTIGAAGGVALGALAVSAEMGQSPKDAVRLAVKVTIANHLYAVGPIKVKSLGEETKKKEINA